MKAAVYTGPGRPSWDDVPKPTVPTQAHPVMLWLNLRL